MKIHLISHSPLLYTGYAGQAGVWARQWQKAGHEVYIQTVFGQRGPALDWNGITILPCSSNTDAQGMDLAMHYRDKLQPDVIITLLDSWVMNPEELGRLNARTPVALWMPVDCLPLSYRDDSVLRRSGAIPVAMSRHGERMLRDAGHSPLYAPHGIDTAFWSPENVQAARKDARAALGVTDETFVIAMNASNGDVMDRKNWFIQLSAFARFLSECPDAVMVAHTCPRSTAMDLESLAYGFLKIPQGRLFFPDQLDLITNVYTQETVRDAVYAAADLLTVASAGEGFCLPLLEAQGCGIPAVTTAASATAEVGAQGQYGALFVSGVPGWCNAHQAVWARPSVLHVQAAYAHARAAWQDRDSKPEWGMRQAAARIHALQYDQDTVMATYWAPVLAGLEDQVAARRMPVAGRRVNEEDFRDAARRAGLKLRSGDYSVEEDDSAAYR